MPELAIQDLIRKLESAARLKSRSIQFHEHETALLLDILRGKVVKTPIETKVDSINIKLDQLNNVFKLESGAAAKFRGELRTNIFIKFFKLFSSK